MKSLIILLVKIYQTFISLFIGRNKCRFWPTCSNYFIESVEKYGVIKGSYFGLARILRCHPFSKKSGFDPVK